MKKRQLFLIILAFSVCVGVSLIIINKNSESIVVDDETAVQQAVKDKQTEHVFCTATTSSQCYLYRCNSGYIYAVSHPAPGSNPLRCTDGSQIERVEEVPSPN